MMHFDIIPRALVSFSAQGAPRPATRVAGTDPGDHPADRPMAPMPTPMPSSGIVCVGEPVVRSLVRRIPVSIPHVAVSAAGEVIHRRHNPSGSTHEFVTLRVFPLLGNLAGSVLQATAR